MFVHPDICPWAKRPLMLPVACFLTALGGFIFWKILGVNPITAALCMGWGIIVLRTLDLHVPPALAVAPLPLVMTNPTLIYPFAVGLGTLLLTGWFFLCEWMLADFRAVSSPAKLHGAVADVPRAQAVRENRDARWRSCGAPARPAADRATPRHRNR